ncbi:maestro heat-like repeat-containing protein family member 1 [Acropora muricata]|uniref:maestro heat-like repeat-containing protein family member 1 n=1 Tax=Acropora muricata TaxID=159855 RepID=UPI0034E3EC4D
MAEGEVRKTGGQVDELCLALIDAANDKQPEVRQMIMTSLHELGKKQPEMVLTAIKGYLIKHQKLIQGHRVVLLKSASKIIDDTLSTLSLDLGKQMIKLATAEMTKSKDIEPDWQLAASEVLVALGGRFDHEVMAELLDKLAPGTLPHYFVVKTLASLSCSNCFGVVPFLKDILGRMLPIMGMAKQDNLRWVIANCIARFCESIIEYVANAENAPYPDITFERFHGEISACYDVLFSVWIRSGEAKVRLAVVDALGHMTLIMAKEKLEEQLPKLLPGITGLYKRHTEHYLITQGLCLVLEAAACKEGGALLVPLIDNLLGGLHTMACNLPDYSNPVSVKNHNEVLRCFSVLTPAFSDRVVAFLLQKLETNNDKARIASLSIIKHLINSSGSFLENKEEMIITGVQILFHDNNLKVRHMFAQCITAMAHHRYLELEGGHRLVEFIVRQSAISDEEKTRRPTDADAISPQELQKMCQNILYLLTTTVDVMEPVLWPYLLECLVPEPFTFAMSSLCRCIDHIAAKKREEQAEDFAIDFEVKTNIPKPVAIISRLLVMSGRPLPGGCRGLHALKLLKDLAPILEPSFVEMWDTVIPKLTQYLEENSDSKDDWKQKTWEDLVLKFFSKSIDEVDSEIWTCSLGAEMTNQIPLYANLPEEKNFLFKCIGVVLNKVKNKDFVQNQLNIVFSSVKHGSQVEREGLAIGIGFSAGTNLDQVLLKLDQVSKTEMTKKSSGILSFMKDKSDSDTEKVKSTVMLCYGYTVLYAPPGLITSRLETSIFRVISRHYTNVKDVHVKQNLIRATELIGKALEPSRLQQPEFVFTKRQEFVNHMLTYMKAESPSVIATETRALAMDACASLAKLKPRFSDAEVFDIVKTSTDCVFSVYFGDKAKNPKEDKDNDKDPWNLFNNAMESLQGLLREILLQDPVPSTLENILKHIQYPWLLSATDFQRERAVNVMFSLLQTFRDNMLLTVGEKCGSFMLAGPLLGRLIPRCTDPVIPVRQTSVDCVQCVLKIVARIEGYSLDSKDELVDALSTLKKRAAEDDANILFSVASDLSKVVAKKLQSDLLSVFVQTLLEGLSDCQAHSASGACVVLNSIVRIRGQELRKDVVELVKDIHTRLEGITHAQTRTGTLRVFRTLASHHLVPVITAILEFPPPLDQQVVDIWRTMAGDPNLALSIFDYVLDLSLRTLPYQEKPKPKSKKETIRVTTTQAIAIACGLTVMFRTEETESLVAENFPRLFAMTLLRLGTSVGLLPPESPASSGKDKHKGPKVEPLDIALECFKELMVRSKYDTLIHLIEKEDGWAMFEDEKTFPDGVVIVARALCKAAPHQVPKIADQLDSALSSVYDAQRIVTTAFFAELIDQKCGGKVSVVEVLMNSLLSRLVDSSHVVRKFCIRGLGNISSVEDSQLEKYSTTILSAMMAGMDDKDDQDDEITLESMSGLAKILAKLDENNVRQILINICLRIRPCFEKEKSSVRAAAFVLFGKLSRFGDGPSKAPFLEQVHTNLVSVLLHLNEEIDVTKACKSCLRSIAPLMGSEQVNQMFQKHLLEEGHLHYGEFMNDLSRLIIVDLADKISFYVMGCVSFFKSSRDDIKANAALFTGFILGNLPKERRYEISKDHVCGALILLLKDPSPKVRCKAAEAISLLYDY